MNIRSHSVVAAVHYVRDIDARSSPHLAMGGQLMLRNLIVGTAAVALAATPIVAQAAPQRIPAPVAAESEELGGSPWLLIIGIAALVGLGIVLLTDGDEDPVSP
jgi:hypothetical protein